MTDTDNDMLQGGDISPQWLARSQLCRKMMKNTFTELPITSQ